MILSRGGVSDSMFSQVLTINYYNVIGIILYYRYYNL